MTTAIVPAAGLGSRLGCRVPKALVQLGSRSLLAYVLSALEYSVDRLVVVVRPGSEPLFADELERLDWRAPVHFALQPEPTGSADAVLRGLATAEDGEQCIVVWADQVGVSASTVARVASTLDGGFPGLVLPLVEVASPYVWFSPDDCDGHLRVWRSRDGDLPPATGWSDVGTFGLVAGAARQVLLQRQWVPGRERDFVYALPDLARAKGLRIVEVKDGGEATGVNSPADLSKAQLGIRAAAGAM
jgi:CTP:molybdopterin cytidylyltransferase MocA